jgi:hypothetical protein
MPSARPPAYLDHNNHLKIVVVFINEYIHVIQNPTVKGKESSLMPRSQLPSSP